MEWISEKEAEISRKWSFVCLIKNNWRCNDSLRAAVLGIHNNGFFMIFRTMTSIFLLILFKGCKWRLFRATSFLVQFALLFLVVLHLLIGPWMLRTVPRFFSVEKIVFLMRFFYRSGCNFHCGPFERLRLENKEKNQLLDASRLHYRLMKNNIIISLYKLTDHLIFLI